MEDNKYEPIFGMPVENKPIQQNSGQPQNIQYQYPYTCPRCGSSSIHRFCDLCGLDAEEYAKQLQYQQQYAPQYQQQQYYQPQFGQGYYQAQTYPNYPKKKSKIGWIIAIVVVVIIGFIVGISILFSSFLSKDKIGGNDFYKDEIITDDGVIPNGVSDEEFMLIKKGMSYAQISSIIGGDGFLSNQGKTPLGESFNTFEWISETNSEKFYYITFINDASTEITVE